jgi:exosortase A-associated hydrolase 2
VLEPFFLDSAGGRIFCSLFRPRRQRANSPVLLFLPPWAEEANKSRRMMARLGHNLADEAGMAMLIPDFFGTGDSTGEFGEADWATWLANVADAAHCLRSLSGGPLYVGGLRAGALVALAARDHLQEAPEAWLFWQPVVNGRQMVQQFLRLRVAGAMGSGEEKETTKGLRARIERGEVVEVAGYELPPGLIGELENQDLAASAPPAGPGLWLNVASNPEQGPPPAVGKVLDVWDQKDAAMEYASVVGDAFWATQELADVPALVTESVAWLRGARR